MSSNLTNGELNFLQSLLLTVGLSELGDNGYAISISLLNKLRTNQLTAPDVSTPAPSSLFHPSVTGPDSIADLLSLTFLDCGTY